MSMFAHVGKHAFVPGGIMEAETPRCSCNLTQSEDMMLNINMQPFLQAGMESTLLPQQIKDFREALNEFSSLKPELDKINLQDVVKYALIRGVAVQLPSNMS